MWFKNSLSNPPYKSSHKTIDYHTSLGETFPLEPERRKYCDMVQFDFVDEYHNITMDSLSALKFALGYNWKGDEPDYVIIADDDAYIHIPNLWRKLYSSDQIQKVSFFTADQLFLN